MSANASPFTSPLRETAAARETARETVAVRETARETREACERQQERETTGYEP